MSEFVRVVKTTISDYLKGAEENILKNQKLTAMLKSKGRITYGHSGISHTWDAKAARNGMVPVTDAQVNSFQRVNRWQQASIPWVGYIIAEAVTKKEKLMNRGKEALVNYATKLGESMEDDIEYAFNGELYIDGTTAANADRILGLQSALGNNGAAQYPTPSATYAGLSTSLGNYGGAALNSSTWPVGQFDSLYYYWSPLIVSYNNSAWGASTNNWANNCLASVRAGLLLQKNLKGLQGTVDMLSMEATMYGSFKDAFGAKERIEVERGGQDSGLVKLGFKDVVNFDGVDVTSEADVPGSMAFGLNFKGLELMSLQDQLFDLDQDEDINTLSDKLATTFYGNLKQNPRSLLFFNAIG